LPPHVFTILDDIDSVITQCIYISIKYYNPFLNIFVVFYPIIHKEKKQALERQRKKEIWVFKKVISFLSGRYIACCYFAVRRL